MPEGNRARLEGVIAVLAVVGLADVAVLNLVAVPGWRQSLAGNDVPSLTVESGLEAGAASSPQSSPPLLATAPVSPPSESPGATPLDQAPEAPGDAGSHASSEIEADLVDAQPEVDEAPPEELTTDLEEQPPAPQREGALQSPPPALPDLRFSTGEAVLGEQGLRVLWEVGRFMRERPSLRVQLRGHADHRGEEVNNDELSSERAAAAQQFLIDRGIERDRIRTVGVGEREPLDVGETASALRRNRRVQVVWQ